MKINLVDCNYNYISYINAVFTLIIKQLLYQFTIAAYYHSLLLSDYRVYTESRFGEKESKMATEDRSTHWLVGTRDDVDCAVAFVAEGCLNFIVSIGSD